MRVSVGLKRRGGRGLGAIGAVATSIAAWTMAADALADDVAPKGDAGSGASQAPSDEPVQRVTVRGTSPPRSASDVVIERDTLGVAPHRTASDLLQVVPGVFVAQHGGEGKAHQIFLRGFDAAHGQDVEIWVGGIPVNEVSNIHGQGYADLHFLPPEVVKEVRSTPGTFDPRQGDFAVAGSIRLKLGYDEPGVTAKGSLGSFGTRRLFAAVRPKSASDETFAAFEEYATDGFGPNRAARRGSLVAQATHDLGRGLTMRALGTIYASRFDSPGVVRVADVEAGRIDRFAVYDPKQGGHSARTQLLLELRKDGEGDHWSVAPFVASRSLSLRQNYTGYLLDGVRGGTRRAESDNTQQLHEDVMVGGTASYRRRIRLISSHDAVEAGVYGRTDWIDQAQRRLSEVDDRPLETWVDARVRATNVAGYVDASLVAFDRLAVRGGVRVDVLSFTAEDRAIHGAAAPSQARTAQGAHVGKKVSLDYGLAPGLHLLASYGEGFRSSQARSLSNGERTPFAEVHGYEAGVRYADHERFRASLAGFHTLLSSDLAFDEVTARNEPVPGTRRTGIAAELLARAAWLTTRASATYTRAVFRADGGRYEAGDRLPYVPELVVRGDIGVNRALARALGRDLVGRAGVGLESIVGRPMPYSEMGRNIFLVDASLGVRLREVELGLDVYNVLDARWYDGQFVYASSFDRGASPSLVPAHHATVGAPRTVLATVSLFL